jgi:hypothetical protein
LVSFEKKLRAAKVPLDSPDYGEWQNRCNRVKIPCTEDSKMRVSAKKDKRHETGADRFGRELRSAAASYAFSAFFAASFHVGLQLFQDAMHTALR